MTRFRLYRLLADSLLIPVIIVVAYSLKFKLGWLYNHLASSTLGKIYDHAQVEPYLSAALFVWILWITTFYACGMYSTFRGFMRDVDEVLSLIKGVTLATIILAVAAFLFDAFPGSRTVILYMWGIGILLIGATRHFLSAAETRQVNKGILGQKALIIGAGSIGQDIGEKIYLYPSHRFQLVGFLANSPPDRLHFHLRDTFNLAGPVTQWQAVIEKHDISVVFISEALPPEIHSEIRQYGEAHRLSIYECLSSETTGKERVEDFDGIPLIQHQIAESPTPLIKRIGDIGLGLTLLILTLPIFAAISCWIKLVSPSGPIFYRQTRVTKSNRLFEMIKFRTMIPNAEISTGPIMVNESGDTRIIPGGNPLRKWSLDELPQLINVIKGDMSLVGPRPERPHFVETFSQELPEFKKRHYMLAGITGWAQVNGRSVLTRQPDQKLKYDFYYIRHYSWIFDLKILLKTFFVVMKKEESY